MHVTVNKAKHHHSNKKKTAGRRKQTYRQRK